MPSVPEIELSANQIYELIWSGNGVATISDAQDGVVELEKNFLERKDLLAGLKNEISETWQGGASEAALGALTQSVDMLIADVDRAVLSNTYMGAQAEAFTKILHTIAPAESPVLTEEEIQGSADGGAEIYRQKLEKWEKQCQINVDAFNTYYDASVHNGQFMPSAYPLLNDGLPPEQNHNISGGAGGGAGGGLASTANPGLSGTVPQKFSSNMDSFTPDHTHQPPPQPGSFQPSTPYSSGYPSPPSTTTHTAGSPGFAGNMYGNPSPTGSHYGGQGYAGGNFGPLGGAGSIGGVPGYYGHIPGGGTEAPKNGRITGSVPTLPPGENAAASARNTPTTPRPGHSAMPLGGAPGGVRNDEQLEHRRPSFLIEPDPDEIFGCNVTTVPPVIGHVPKPKPSEK